MATYIQRDGYLWQVIFFCFLAAALTGVLFRAGMTGWLPGELSLQNIRHAHSHLMFFGWASALPLYMVYRRALFLTTSSKERVRGVMLMKWSLRGTLLFGLLSFPFFLFYGYHPVPVGNMALPVSVILSGLVMICWYVYLAGYLWVRKDIPAAEQNVWFEGALVMLVISSFGAWGVAVVQTIGLPGALAGKAMTHFFLACFTEGWVVLATLAMLDEWLETEEQQFPVSKQALAAAIMLGAPLTFPYGIPESLLTLPMLGTARAGGVMAGGGLLFVIVGMFRSGKSYGALVAWPLWLLLAKGVLQVAASVIPAGFWLSDHALRIFYLHLLLLGGFTLAGIGLLHAVTPTASIWYIMVSLSIAAVLASLLLLTRFWPVTWSGMWIYYAVTVVAILPVVTVGLEWWTLKSGTQEKS
ncbi:MAG: hypothetical protein R3281_03700 [Balneolaceae bacterium]|nr:hypothetical protein [Balneolaceae bacterium]